MTLAVFGLVARQAAISTSDVDLLIVADPLPRGRIPRVREFEAVEALLEPQIRDLARQGVHTYLSPIFKTPEEAHRFSLLFLDMTWDIRFLKDANGFFHEVLDRLRKRLEQLGGRRVSLGAHWYWILKADYRYGEVFDL